MASKDSGTFRTMCPMNCHPTLCGMLVQVADGRVTRVKGDPDNPDSRGFLCMRGHASREIIGNPDRLLRPLVRDGRGDTPWRETSWDEALDRIAGTMRAVGPAAVGLWTGHGLFANNYGTRVSSYLARRFANLCGAQWWSGTMICWGLGRLRARPHRRARGQHEGGHGRAQRAHRHVGRQPREPAEHRPPRRRGPRARRARHHDRRARDRRPPAVRRADRPAPRHRRGAGARDDARHHRRRALRPRLRRRAHGGLRRAGRARRRPIRRRGRRPSPASTPNVSSRSRAATRRRGPR